MDAKNQPRSFDEQLAALEAELGAQNERVATLMREHNVDARDLEDLEVPEPIRQAFVASIEERRAPQPTKRAPMRGFVVRG